MTPRARLALYEACRGDQVTDQAATTVTGRICRGCGEFKLFSEFGRCTNGKYANARRVIDRHEKKIAAVEKAIQGKHRAAVSKAKEAIHFGTEKEALTAIKKVEEIARSGN